MPGIDCGGDEGGFWADGEYVSRIVYSMVERWPVFRMLSFVDDYQCSMLNGRGKTVLC